MVVTTFADPSYNPNRFALMFNVFLTFLFYEVTFLSHVLVQNRITKRMKSFSSDIASKYIYGIALILAAIPVSPYTFLVFLSYIYFLSMIASLIGYILNHHLICLISNSTSLGLTLIIAIVILSSSWALI